MRVHDLGVRLALVALVLCACRATPPVAVVNRGGAAETSCTFRLSLDVEARRFANVDAGDPDYHVWTPGRATFQLRRTGNAVRGEVRIVGTGVAGGTFELGFEAAGTLDEVRCELALDAQTHDPFHAMLRFSPGAITGKITSIDDTWWLGPPFPPPR